MLISTRPFVFQNVFVDNCCIKLSLPTFILRQRIQRQNVKNQFNSNLLSLMVRRSPKKDKSKKYYSKYQLLKKNYTHTKNFNSK